MEKILAGMRPDEPSLWAGIHALKLAERIMADLSILFVTEPEPDGLRKNQDPDEGKIKEKIHELIKQGREKGVRVSYYVASGDFAAELIRFIRENKITLLVIGCPEGGIDPEISSEFIGKIKRRLHCRIEVVSAKPKHDGKRR